MTRGRFINDLGEDIRWPFIGVEESAVVVDVCTKPKSADIFGQISGGILTIRAPFCLIEDPRLHEAGEHATANPVLNLKVRQYLRYEEEFKQKHQAHSEQRFAVVRLMRTSRSGVSEISGVEGYHLPGAEILVLESAEAEENTFTGKAKHDEEKGRKEFWRRIAFMPMQVPFMAEDENTEVLFLDEMNKAKWKWMDVTII